MSSSCASKSLLFLTIIVISLTIIVVSDVFATNDDVVVLDIPGQGLVQGSKTVTAWTNQTIFSFLGIPYAESPSGNLRFKAPVTRAPWRHIHDGTKYGMRCPVITSIQELPANLLNRDLEDCLNLCVYTKNVTDKRPVMFYIYGGGFYNGSASDHPPKYLLEKDIVLVVAQYRVGAVGWLSTQSEQMPGNSPVLDIRMALQWVQDHVHIFGGDPTQVTIFSQSAGAAVAGMLLLSPTTPTNLFSRVIIQSGSILAPWAVKKNPLLQAQTICRKNNCTSCEEKDEIYKCLREVHILDLLEATTEDSFGLSKNDFHGVMPLPPSELIKAYSHTYPIMTGITKHDGTFALASFYDTVKSLVGNMSFVPPREFLSQLFDASKEPDPTGLSINLLTALLYNDTELNTLDHKQNIPAYIDQSSILFMKSPVFTFAKKMLKKNSKVYVYSFDYEGEWTRFGYEFGNQHYPFDGGAHHSNDNIYLFSTHNLNEKDKQISDKMVDLWSSFAINGAPKTETGPDILPLASESGPYFHIDDEIRIGTDLHEELQATVNDPYKERFIRPDIEF